MTVARPLALALAAALAFAAPAAQAHKAWLLPSATTLAEDGWITVDGAVSNDLFHFNHVPLRLDALRVTGPDGQPVQVQNPHTGRYRSVFDLELTAPGTYRIAIANAGLFASWTENGAPKRWRGTPEAFAREVPADAAELRVTQAASRIESFVTVGAPTTTALAPTGQGLELVPVTHPNDLVAGEEARFALHIDGQPAAGVEVEVVRGGTRYRDRQDEIRATTGADGGFSLTWPEAGMYWLEASLEDERATLAPATARRASYVATFEVLPL